MIESDIQRLIQADATARGGKTCKLCGLDKVGTHNTYCKSCYNAYKRRWYLKHRVEEISRCAGWNKKNKRRVADNMQACRDRRPNHFRQYAKTYIKNHPEQYQAYSRNNNLRRAGYKKSGSLMSSEWKVILKASRGRCFYCRLRRKMTIDHYIPMSKGGLHSASNIVAACWPCNHKKNAMMPDLFIKKMGFK